MSVTKSQLKLDETIRYYISENKRLQQGNDLLVQHIKERDMELWQLQKIRKENQYLKELLEKHDIEMGGYVQFGEPLYTLGEAYSMDGEEKFKDVKIKPLVSEKGRKTTGTYGKPPVKRTPKGTFKMKKDVDSDIEIEYLPKSEVKSSSEEYGGYVSSSASLVSHSIVPPFSPSLTSSQSLSDSITRVDLSTNMPSSTHQPMCPLPYPTMQTSTKPPVAHQLLQQPVPSLSGTSTEPSTTVLGSVTDHPIGRNNTVNEDSLDDLHKSILYLCNDSDTSYSYTTGNKGLSETSKPPPLASMEKMEKATKEFAIENQKSRFLPIPQPATNDDEITETTPQQSGLSSIDETIDNVIKQSKSIINETTYDETPDTTCDPHVEDTTTMMKIPQNLANRFMERAKLNTRRNIETCGILAGHRKGNCVTHLVIPKQVAASNSCTPDMSGMKEILSGDLIQLGWIHTHPSPTAFLSSVGIYTYYSYQYISKEPVAIVCAPSHNETKVFRLTDNGINAIKRCMEKDLHPPETAQYMECTNVQFVKGKHLNVEDLRTMA